MKKVGKQLASFPYNPRLYTFWPCHPYLHTVVVNMKLTVSIQMIVGWWCGVM